MSTSVVEKVDLFEKASQMFLKGYKPAEIARELEITPAHAKSLITEYQTFIVERVQDDPDLLDRVVENTLELLDEVKLLSKEAWQLYDSVKENEIYNQMNMALKLAGEFTDKKAKLLQLMGGKTDSSNMAKLQRLERVNEIVSSVIKDIIAECPKCRVEAQVRLAEAFKLMDKPADVAPMEAVPNNDQDEDIVDGEIV